MSKQPQQADDEIHENQLLSSLIDSLNGEAALSFAEDTRLDAKDIYKALVGIYAGGTSVSIPCKGDEDAPHEDSVLYHLRIKSDLKTLEQVSDMPLQEDILDALPR